MAVYDLQEQEQLDDLRACDRIVAMALGQIVLDKPKGETSIEEVQDML